MDYKFQYSIPRSSFRKEEMSIRNKSTLDTIIRCID